MRFRTVALILGLIVLAVCSYNGYRYFLWSRATVALQNSRTLASFIVIELQNYALSNDGQLPPAIEMSNEGTPMHSWRFVSCRFLFGDMVQVGFYGQDAGSAYKLPWNHPQNRVYFNGPHRYYGGSPIAFIDQEDGDNTTRFAAITGPDTAFEKNKTIRFDDLDDDTILFVETRNSNHHWMKPGGDFDVLNMSSTIGDPKGISGRNPEGFIVAFADEKAWILKHEIPFETLKPFLTISGSKSLDRDVELKKYRLY